MKPSRIIALIIGFSALPPPALAYIDPMAGSAILYVLFGLLSAIWFALGNAKQRLIMLLKGQNSAAISTFERDNVVFYSEGAQYWSVFEPVISALAKRKCHAIYLTADKGDPGLAYRSEYLTAEYIGPVERSFAYINRIKAPLVVMTTPQIDIMALRRSKDVKHYSYIFHAPTDAHTYRKFAFDYFDSVFCSGEHQINSIRALERKRKLPPKRLYRTGLTYFDFMAKEIDGTAAVSKITPGPVVLIAPTWQEHSLLHRAGPDLLERLMSAGYEVILRPHPQTYVSYPKLIREIERTHADDPRFSIDRQPQGLESFAKADIMLSDLSGVVFDFTFFYRKPVIMLDFPFSGMGTEATDIEHPMWDLEARHAVGHLINEDQLADIPSLVEKVLKEHRPAALDEFIETALYNFKHAGEPTARELTRLLAEQNGG